MVRAKRETPPALPTGKRRAGATPGTSGNPVGVHRSVSASQLRQRRLKAVELRVHGWTYEEIALHQGLAMRTVRDDVEAIMSEVEAENVPRLREIESQRLNLAVYNALRIMADHPGTELSLKATDRLLRAVQTRANLFGLNAPVEVTLVERTEIDNEVAKLIEQLNAQNEETQRKIIDGAVVTEELPALDVT